MKNIDPMVLFILGAFVVSIILIFIGVIIYAGIGPALITLGACIFIAVTSIATFANG